MTRYKHARHYTFCFYFFMLTILSGCALFESTEKETKFAQLTVIAAKNLNPAVDGRASPIFIRIYQLSQTAKFDNSDFFALYEKDQSLLAGDLQSRIELEIKPDEKYSKPIELKPNTRFIAVLAAFRDLDNSQWKAMKTFSIDKNQTLTIRLNKNSVIIEEK